MSEVPDIPCDSLEKPFSSRFRMGCLAALGLSAVVILSAFTYEYMRRQSQAELLRKEMLSPIQLSFRELFLQYLDGERRTLVHSGTVDRQFSEVIEEKGMKTVISNVIGDDYNQHESHKITEEGTFILRRRIVYEKNTNQHRYTSSRLFKSTGTNRNNYSYHADGDVDMESGVITLQALSSEGPDPNRTVKGLVSISRVYEYDFPLKIQQQYLHLLEPLIQEFEEEIMLNGVKYRVVISPNLRMELLVRVLNGLYYSTRDEGSLDLVRAAQRPKVNSGKSAKNPQ